jgi:hypothetical protein
VGGTNFLLRKETGARGAACPSPLGWARQMAGPLALRRGTGARGAACPSPLGWARQMAGPLALRRGTGARGTAVTHVTQPVGLG